MTVTSSVERGVAVLVGIARMAEAIEAAYRKKESELGRVFEGLSRAEARALHRRLATPAAGDGLATQLAGLGRVRREKFLALLAGYERDLAAQP